MAQTIPAWLAARMAAMFALMGSRGQLDAVSVYGLATQNDLSGNAVARPRVLLATLQAYVQIGGGTLVLGQEGTRVAITDQIFYLPDPSLTEANYPQRWLVLPTRAGYFRRISTCQTVGPYSWCQLEGGGTSDIAGNVK